MLPGRFPNLLVNGASGIAVGLATNIPPHNLAEAIDGVVAYIDKPNIKLEELMKYIPAPDFPTGGYIIAGELNEAYKTGKGKITLRARMKIEQGEADKKNIVITEFPYQVNKANLLRRIAELREEKKDDLAAITRVTDESDRVGTRAVVEVRGNADIPAILKILYKYTDLETTFGINMVAIAGGKPVLMGILDIIKYYVNYQREVVLRRTKFDLNQAKERCHILEGLIIAVKNIDEVIKIIKKSESTSDARQKLRDRFSLSERQAQAILDLRLARLTKLEVYKLEEELKQLKELIEKLTAIVGSTKLQLDVVKQEILEIKKNYKLPRKSTLVFDEKDAAPERKDIRQPGVKSVLCVSAAGTLKCVSEKNYAAANKAVSEKTKPAHIVSEEMNLMSDEDALVFTNLGKCFHVRADACICKYTDSGFSLQDLFDDAEKGEKPIAVFPAAKLPEGCALFITKSGMLKKTEWSEYAVSKESFQAIKLSDGDEVVSVQTESDGRDDTIVFISEGGMCLNARKDDIPVQGRISVGVKGMNLNEGDSVLFASQVDGAGEIVVAISSGRYKRVIVAQINSLPRYRKGVQIASLKDEDKVIFADYVTTPYMLAVKTKEGYAEISTEDIPIDVTSTRGRAIKALKEEPVAVYAMKNREAE